MTELSLNIETDDLPIIKRLKKSLINKFRSKSENDIDKAVELANYMVSIKSYTEAKIFLESFVYLDPKLNDSHLWPANVQGILLLVYIARITNKVNEYQNFISILETYDVWPTDMSRLAWYESYREDHEKKIKYASSETHKYKCSIIGQELLTFMYFNEILLEHEKPNMWTKLKTKNLKSILEESQRLLVECLNEK